MGQSLQGLTHILVVVGILYVFAVVHLEYHEFGGRERKGAVTITD